MPDGFEKYAMWISAPPALMLRMFAALKPPSSCFVMAGVRCIFFHVNTTEEAGHDGRIGEEIHLSTQEPPSVALWLTTTAVLGGILDGKPANMGEMYRGDGSERTEVVDYSKYNL